MTSTKIDTASNIEELLPYACAKAMAHTDWYLSCISCASPCKVGNRVVDILENETKCQKTQVEKFKEREEKTRSIKYIKALNSDDPVGYLVNMGHFEKPCDARTELRRWMKRNKIEDPRLASQYRPIFGEDRVATLLKGTTSGRDILENLAKDMGNSKRQSGVSNLYRWIKIFPVVCYGHEDAMREAASILYKYSIKDETVEDAYNHYISEQNKKEEEVIVNDTDEISIEDFLKDSDTNNIESDQIVESVESEKKDITDEFSRFSSKEAEIEKVIDQIDNEIKRLDRKRSELREQINTLEKARELLGL